MPPGDVDGNRLRGALLLADGVWFACAVRLVIIRGSIKSSATLSSYPLCDAYSTPHPTNAFLYDLERGFACERYAPSIFIFLQSLSYKHMHARTYTIRTHIHIVHVCVCV